MNKEEIIKHVYKNYQIRLEEKDGNFYANYKVVIKDKNYITLPDNLFVKEMYIINCNNVDFPVNFHVNDTLYIDNCNNISFNEVTQIDKEVNLNNSTFIVIPSSVKFNGNIKLHNVKFNMFTLPLLVKEDLSINNTNLTSLPDNLIIRGDLRIENNPISELPLNLRVRKNILIQNSNINRIQNGLICEQLLLPDDIVSFPKDYIVTYKISGTHETLNALDFSKHPCHLIVINDDDFFECKCYDNYRRTIVFGIGMFVEENRTYIWKMYDKEYIYFNGRILEVIKKIGNVYDCKSIVNHKRNFCVIQINEDKFICGKNLTDVKLQLIRYSFQKTYWKIMSFDTNTKVSHDTAKQIFNMFKYYIKFNADVSLPIKDEYTIKEIIELTN